MAMTAARMMYSAPPPIKTPTNPDVGFYSNSLRSLLTDPSSFTADPGYQFARSEALRAVTGQNSNMLGSGNLLNALEDRASGLASQAYDNRVNQLSGLLGTSANYDLGLGRNAIDAQTGADQFQLGSEQNANTAQRNANDFALGTGELGVNATRTGNDFTLGLLGAGNTATRNAQDYALGMGSLGNTAQRNANDFNIGSRAADTNFYDAQTRRGSAQSNADFAGNQTALDWNKYYDSVYPRRRIAGGF